MSKVVARRWLGWAGCVFGGLLIGCGPSARELQLEANVSGLDKQLQTLQAAKTQDEAELKSKDAQLAKLGASQTNASTSMNRLEQALAEYKQRADQLAQIEARYRDLRTRLEKLRQVGVKFVVRDNRMVIQLPGDVLFDSGKDALKKDGRDVLAQVADVVRNDKELYSRVFQVAGHTDDVKYPANGPFKDNWGLSLARARQVLLFLVAPVDGGKPGKGTLAKGAEGGGLDATKLSAAGFAETRPEAGTVGNESEAERQKNRRVELVLQPDVREMLNLGNLN